MQTEDGHRHVIGHGPGGRSHRRFVEAPARFAVVPC